MSPMAASRWGERFTARYRYMLVDRATGREKRRLDFLKGGTVTRNNDVRIMESAEVEAVGPVDFGPDLVRIYLDAEWPDGETASVPLGTFLPAGPKRSVTSGYSLSSVKLSGRLQELMDDKFSTPFTLAKGDKAVDAARRACEEIGLTVIADPSDYRVTDPRSYGVGAKQNNSETGDTKLDMVNDLLSLAGFRAAKTDPYGRVLLRRYVDPMGQAASWSFEEGPGCRFERSMTDEFDYTSTPNHVVVRYESEERAVVGEAFDNDPASRLSTVSRGRTITRSYEYTSMPPGDDEASMQVYADERARRLLSTAQSTVRRVSLTHVYAPVTVNDSVRLRYPSGSIDGLFEVRVQKIRLVGGCPVDAEFRRFER